MAYSSLEFIVESGPDWTPGVELFRSIAHYFGATEIWSLIGYGEPLYLEKGADSEPRAAFQYSDLEVEEGLRILSEKLTAKPGLLSWKKAKVICVGFTCEEWSEKLDQSLSHIPESLSEGFVPWDVSICIGPFSILTMDHEKVLGRYKFKVGLGGDGMPGDWDAYMGYIRSNPEITKLLEFLQKESGKRWSIIPSSSY